MTSDYNSFPLMVARLDSRDTSSGRYDTPYFSFRPCELESEQFTKMDDIPNLTFLVQDGMFRTFRMAFYVSVQKGADFKGVDITRLVQSTTKEFFDHLDDRYSLAVLEKQHPSYTQPQSATRTQYLTGLLRFLTGELSYDIRSGFKTIGCKSPFRLYLRYDLWIESRLVSKVHLNPSKNGSNTLKGLISFKGHGIFYVLNADTPQSLAAFADNKDMAVHIEEKFFNTWPMDAHEVQFTRLFKGEDVPLSLNQLCEKYRYNESA